MPKNIVVFSDWPSPKGEQSNSTNVHKLFKMVEDRTAQQITYYDSGIGTGWSQVVGIGISQSIFRCYEFIVKNYKAGDQIFLFGFSRGAYTVRILSSLIHLFGILPQYRPELVRQALKIYKVADTEKRYRLSVDFTSQHRTIWCRIKFLGVWDMITAPAAPFKIIDIIQNMIPFFRHKFHDLRLSDSVENAYHAIAIDDERLTYHPKIWDKEITSHQTMKQVWFCGMHNDVGGGYKEQELSDIPLVWIQRMAKTHGLRIYSKHNVQVNPDANGMMHDSRGGTLTKFYRKKIRRWNSHTHGKPMVHESVLQRKLNNQNKKDPPYKPWILHFNYEVETEHFRSNPYVVGSPIIDKDMFFGRSVIISKIVRGIHNNHYYILGERRSGKTSLLKRLTEEIEKINDQEYNFQPVPIDFQSISEKTFFKLISKELLKSADSLISRFLLKTTSEKLTLHFKSYTEKANCSDDFVDLFSLMYEVISAELNTPIIFVLMMDEFDKINEFDVSLKEEFRSIFMQSEMIDHLRLVAAGGKLEIWDRSSPFNFMIELDISQLSTEDARQLVLTPSKGVVVWQDKVVDYILNFSQKKPYEIQKLCFSIVDYALKNVIFEIDDSLLQNFLAQKEHREVEHE